MLNPLHADHLVDEPDRIADGHVTGRLSRLYLPAASEELRPPAETGAPRRRLPAMDLSVDDFRVAERQFGRMTLRATPAGEDWRIDQLEMCSPEGTLSVSGVWQSGGARPATQVDVNLDMVDMGRYLARLKLPPGIKGGSGKLAGQLAWGGPTYAPDVPTLRGALSLDLKRGQFVKLEPGLGKLISVLSLQALPRRVTLDFADVFSEGFTFDRISATAGVAQGLVRTNDFRMVGPTGIFHIFVYLIIRMIKQTQNSFLIFVPKKDFNEEEFTKVKRSIDDIRQTAFHYFG